MKRNYFLIGVLAGLAFNYARYPCGCTVMLVLGVIMAGALVVAMLHSVTGIVILLLAALIWAGAIVNSRTR